MPTTVSLTLSDADVVRVQAAATALGSTPKALVVAYLISLVRGYEQQQNQTQYASTYTPIGPS